MPTVETARIRLDQALRTAKLQREKCVKIIHGYGSSGKGGAIKRDVLAELARRRSGKQIKAFVPGEKFTPFDASARQILNACPELGRDKDYSRGNYGITIVLL